MLGAAFLGFTGTFALESSYSARARKVQVVRIDRTHNSLFGPVTIDVGDPVPLILDDESAFLKNKTSTGLPMLDADYLNRHGGAALQLQTVESVVALARLGCVLSLAVAAAGLVLLNRLRSFLIPPDP